MKRPVFREDTHGVSPIISAILLLTIMLLVVGTIMAWAIPRIQSLEYDAQYDGAFTGFEVVDSRMDDVIYGSAGTSRTAEIAIGGGDLLLGVNDGYWLVYWSLIQDNVTIGRILSKDSSFPISFDVMPVQDLTVNITGTGGAGNFTPSDGKVSPGFIFGEYQYITIFNGTTVIAEAYYFKTNVIEYQLRTNDGYYEIKWMNGAIITNRGSSSGAVSDSPYIYAHDDSLFINMITLTANRTGFISAGPGTYALNIRNLRSTLLTMRSVYGLRLAFQSEYSKGLYSHFDLHMGFENARNSRYQTVATAFNPGEFTHLKLQETRIEVTGEI